MFSSTSESFSSLSLPNSFSLSIEKLPSGFEASFVPGQLLLPILILMVYTHHIVFEQGHRYDGKLISKESCDIITQGVIQALLLTSVFHKGLSFMVADCGYCSWGFKPPGFQIIFPCTFWWPNLFLFKATFFFLCRLFTPLMTPKGKKRISKVLSNKSIQFLLLFTFWIKGLSFKTQFKFEFWPLVKGGQLVVE